MVFSTPGRFVGIKTIKITKTIVIMSIFSKIKTRIWRVRDRIGIIKTWMEDNIPFYRHYRLYKIYSRQYKHYLELQHFEDKKADGEEAYLQKWKALSPRVEPYSYRFFSHYLGYTPNIIPEDIGRTYIEDVLNPLALRPVYYDKNLFPEIIGKENVPRTIVCRINGSQLLNAEYKLAEKELSEYIGEAENLILKPTVGSCSGRGIIKFVKKGNAFVSTDGKTTLSKAFLESYHENFCLQEAVYQHDFMNKLCPTSVNTIRLCLYRSVKNEKPKVTASIIRIGKNGAFVDNACAGGMFIGVNVATGEMGKFVIDHFGNKKNVWNNIDFSQNTFIVPNWQEVIAFAEYVGNRIHHHRLIALDIALNKDGKPILIEYNIDWFSFWLYEYTNQEVFGEYLDEIIDYCKKKKQH